MRTVNAAAQALLDRIAAGEQIPLVQLVEMRLASVTLYYTTAGVPLQWAGHTWASVGGRIEPLNYAAKGTVDQLQFSLPGVTEDDIALALNEPVEGRVVVVYDALVDPDTGVVADAIQAWVGTLNVPGLEDGPVATVSVTAEHRAISAQRAKPSRYTNDQQQRLYPGDTCLNFDPATDAAPLAWPAASYFRK